jgi:cellulose synthase/poly-beta-1,6-N-acetylglucosamine synthase-like glycosyltransferase
MLDILPDVTSEFEVLVIDDGSTDQTEEVARDLAIEFPQVHVTRHAKRLGGEEVIRTGYEQTSGKVVIVQQENTAFGQADLHRLWQMHAEPLDESPEMHPTQLDSATEDYLTAWSAAFRNRMQPPSRE